MNAHAMTVLADADRANLLESLSPLQLFFASLGLLVVAGIVYGINKEFFKGESFLADMAAFICGLAGILGLLNALFG